MKRAKRNLKSVFARKRRGFKKLIRKFKTFKQRKEDEKRFQHEVAKDL